MQWNVWCQVCDTGATSRRRSGLSRTERDARVLPWEVGWTPACKIQRSAVNLSDWKAGEVSPAFLLLGPGKIPQTRLDV